MPRTGGLWTDVDSGTVERARVCIFGGAQQLHENLSGADARSGVFINGIIKN